jgi:hypothetical protein
MFLLNSSRGQTVFLSMRPENLSTEIALPLAQKKHFSRRQGRFFSL